MAYYHKNLTQKKWNSYTIEAQILNIASEFTRAKSWILRGNQEYKRYSIERALELIDLTSNDKRWHKLYGKLRELLRMREVIAELYEKENISKDYPAQIIRTLLNFTKETSLVEV